MNLLSRRSLLAIAAVVDVALHARGAPVAAKALAARHDLPPRHLETLLQSLVRASILKGVRGPRGGYELARERRRISVGEIVRVVSDDGDEATASPLVTHVIAPRIEEVGRAFLEALEAISVDDLCKGAEQSIPIQQSGAYTDFTI